MYGMYVGIVCMVGVVITFHMYGMCGMYDRYDIGMVCMASLTCMVGTVYVKHR